MVNCNESVFFFVPFQHREFCDPQECEIVGSCQFQHFAQFQTQSTQRVEYHFILVSADQDQVTGLTFHSIHDFLQFFRCEEFCDLRFQSTVFVYNDPSQTFCSVCFYEFNQRVDFLSGEGTAAFCIDCSYAAACFQCGFEYNEFCATNHIGDVFQFHAETYVGFIGTETFHSFCISHSGQRQLDVNVHQVFEYLLHHSFVDVHDIFDIYEGQFHVNLCKFRLSVCSQVFVTEAFCDLVVSVHTGYHQELFVQLRGLRQTIEVTGVYTGRYQIVSCAFGCGFTQDRCFDFQEVFLIQEVSHYLYYFMTQHQVVQLRRSSQIQITIFQTQVVFYCDVVFDLERCCFGIRKDSQFLCDNFDLTCFHVRVDVAFCSCCNQASNCQYIFTADCFCFCKQFFFCCVFIDGDLHQTCLISQGDEDQLTQVTTALYPAHHSYFLTDHRFAHVCTHAASFQSCQSFTHDSISLLKYIFLCFIAIVVHLYYNNHFSPKSKVFRRKKHIFLRKNLPCRVP